jgi:hypothetical protein
VYGYDMIVERDASEFLDLRDVSPKGFAIRGSGKATIVTPSLYRPGRRYSVSGTGGQKQLRADGRGRLHIVVDLGSSHTSEQYSPQGRVMSQAADYWTERRVSIR